MTAFMNICLVQNLNMKPVILLLRSSSIEGYLQEIRLLFTYKTTSFRGSRLGATSSLSFKCLQTGRWSCPLPLGHEGVSFFHVLGSLVVNAVLLFADPRVGGLNPGRENKINHVSKFSNICKCLCWSTITLGACLPCYAFIG